MKEKEILDGAYTIREDGTIKINYKEKINNIRRAINRGIKVNGYYWKDLM